MIKKRLKLPGAMVSMLLVIFTFSNCVHHVKEQANKDFFMYVNGEWIKNNPIPATESSWGSFNELRDKNRTLLHKILDSVSAIKSVAKGSNAQLIGDFYASGMDSAVIEKGGISPLHPEIERINAIKDSKDVMADIAHLQRYGIFPLFWIMVDQDAKVSNQYALYASQGGLGLPNKGYYFENDEKSVTIRNQYKAHVKKMFALTGENDAESEKNAETVLKMETGLAGASMGPVELRDPLVTYNKMTMHQVKEMAPEMNWENYLAEANIAPVSSMIVSQPKFFKKVNEDLKTVSIADWKTYLKWHLVHNTARF
jgi:putative endopeptidase